VAEAATGEPAVYTGDPNPEAEKVVKEWYAAWEGDEAGMVAAIDKLLHPEGFHVNVAMGERHGVDEAKTGIPEMMKTIENPKTNVTTLVSAGDWVFAVGSWSGKQVGDMGPIKATNKEFALDFAELNHVVDGKIKESYGYENPLQLMMALGVVPPPAEVAQK
jgi:hypothetical protein